MNLCDSKINPRRMAQVHFITQKEYCNFIVHASFADRNTAAADAAHGARIAVRDVHRRPALPRARHHPQRYTTETVVCLLFVVVSFWLSR